MTAFTHVTPIVDGQAIEFDDNFYRANIKPMGDMSLVTVTLLDIHGADFDATSHLSQRSARDQEALNITVWDLIGSLERMWIGNQADVQAQEKADQRVDWNEPFDYERFDAQR